jgi:hypothetical protein
VGVIKRKSARPTFDINGLTSGYQGEGAKTVLPAKASANTTATPKVRLVIIRFEPDFARPILAPSTDGAGRSRHPPNLCRFLSIAGRPVHVPPP